MSEQAERWQPVIKIVSTVLAGIAGPLVAGGVAWLVNGQIKNSSHYSVIQEQNAQTTRAIKRINQKLDGVQTRRRADAAHKRLNDSISSVSDQVNSVQDQANNLDKRVDRLEHQ